MHKKAILTLNELSAFSVNKLHISFHAFDAVIGRSIACIYQLLKYNRKVAFLLCCCR